MKKILTLLSCALFFSACQTNVVQEVEMTSLDTAAFPYKVKDYGNWQMNSNQSNVTLAMNTVKAFCALDTNALKPMLGDSIHLTIDAYEFKGTNSQFLAMAKEEMNKYKSIQVKMQDVESVMSKDKKTEYVSLWYKQYNEMKDGTRDSVNLFNDFKIKNGKVIEWSEYVQRFMKK